MVDVKMPQMGESIAEGTISVWLIDVGQYVEENQPLVTVSTDKADVDIPAPASGVLAEVIAGEGKTVPVGALIARIDETKAVAKKPEIPVEGRREGPAEHPLVKEGVPAAEAMREVVPEEEVQAPPEIEREPMPQPPAEERRETAGFYSPAVMRLAVEHGVDLKAVQGTGEGGRVTKADVTRYVEARERPPRVEVPPRAAHEGFGSYSPPVYEAEPEDAEMPFSRLRRLIADHMVYSKRTSPHVTTFAEADLDKAVAVREKQKDRIKEKTGVTLTYMPFVMVAAIRALKEYPLMNSVVQGDRILTKRRINLGVAVDTERGLLVPVIKDAGGMDLMELARALDDISKRVRDRKVTPDELAGGTFTVTNPGRHGNLFGTPIISQPQVGILRMGELVKRPLVVEVDGEDAIAIRPVMYLSLSYDHRVVDGLTANEFLHRIKEHLEGGEFAL